MKHYPMGVGGDGAAGWCGTVGTNGGMGIFGEGAIVCWLGERERLLNISLNAELVEICYQHFAIEEKRVAGVLEEENDEGEGSITSLATCIPRQIRLPSCFVAIHASNRIVSGPTGSTGVHTTHEKSQKRKSLRRGRGRVQVQILEGGSNTW